MTEYGKSAGLKGVKVCHLHTEGTAPYVEEECLDIFQTTCFFVGPNMRKPVAEGRAEYGACVCMSLRFLGAYLEQLRRKTMRRGPLRSSLERGLFLPPLSADQPLGDPQPVPPQGPPRGRGPGPSLTPRQARLLLAGHLGGHHAGRGAMRQARGGAFERADAPHSRGRFDPHLSIRPGFQVARREHDRSCRESLGKDPGLTSISDVNHLPSRGATCLACFRFSAFPLETSPPLIHFPPITCQAHATNQANLRPIF